MNDGLLLLSVFGKIIVKSSVHEHLIYIVFGLVFRIKMFSTSLGFPLSSELRPYFLQKLTYISEHPVSRRLYQLETIFCQSMQPTLDASFVRVCNKDNYAG